MNKSTCCAPCGTVTLNPSLPHVSLQSLQAKNHFSGGGFVDPLKNAATIKYWTDCVSGRSALIHTRSPGARFGTSEAGRGLLPRVTLTSKVGPARSDGAGAPGPTAAIGPDST